MCANIVQIRNQRMKSVRKEINTLNSLTEDECVLQQLLLFILQKKLKVHIYKVMETVTQTLNTYVNTTVYSDMHM